MGRKIILLSDGTGNSSAKVWRTNVWRVFESLHLSSSDQVAFYDDGVGTSSFKPLAVVGGAFGWGLKRNVLDLYKFVCRNYKSKEDYERLEDLKRKDGRQLSGDEKANLKDDEIFAFGFSRGAFTIRVLIGFIVDQGLVTYESEEELNRKTKAAYRAYRAKKFRSKWRFEAVLRPLRNLFVSASHDENERPVKEIRFIGLWDTVAAYGLPIDEMTRGISRYLFPLELPNRQLDSKVRRACHALALDDERTTFHPVLWDESREAPITPDAAGVRQTSHERISQVWFTGVHSNVGGGYPDDSLAHVSLTWILAEAQQCGLKFKRQPDADPDAIVHARSAQDKDGRLYDSRSGLGGYYRYGPRKLAELCRMSLSKDLRDCVDIERPKIHESVLDRVKVRAHLYAPIGLPEKYELVTYDGRILSPTENTYETPQRAKDRCEAQETLWNVVWRRRAIYFLTVFTSLYLAIYPLYIETFKTAEYATRLRPVSDALRLLQTVLPDAVTPWINVYAREPAYFLLVAGLVAALIFVGSRLGGSISDRMNGVWKVALNLGVPATRQGADKSGVFRLVLLLLFVFAMLYVVLLPWLPRIPYLDGFAAFRQFNRYVEHYGAFPVRGILSAFLIVMFLPAAWVFSLRNSTAYKATIRAIKLRIAPAFFAFFFVYLGFVSLNHLAFTVEDAFGLVCPESRRVEGLRLCPAQTIAMCDEGNRPICENRRLSPVCLDGLTATAPVCSNQKVAMCQDGPAVCPKICDDDVRTIVDPADRPRGRTSDRSYDRAFDTKNICQPTRVMLEQWGHYRLTVTPKDHWSAFNGTIETSTKGFRISTMKNLGLQGMMLALWPLKRSFLRPWFAVVARVGSRGNYENFMDPDEDSTSNVLSETIHPERNGELFLYVNHAAIGWPFSYIIPRDFFYQKNSGTAEIKIEQIRR